MELSDEDPFAISDEEEETTQVSSRNPVEELLLKQMHDTTERVEKARSNFTQVQKLTEKILKKLHTKAIYGESNGSDTDNDLYQVTGEPVTKKIRKHRASASQPLKIEKVWQQVIDDKWIIGILIKNTTSRTFQDPCVYVTVKDQPEVRGVSSFWEVVDCLSSRTDELPPDIEKLVATVVLELPNFENTDYYDAFGTISYVFDNKHLQTLVPTLRLNVTDVVDKNFGPRFSANIENTILAIKSICVDREVSISLDNDNTGSRLLTFLENNGFRNSEEEAPDVYIARSTDFLRHSIFEILPCSEKEAPVRISAKSPSQLEVIMRLLRHEFPDIPDEEVEYRTMEAAKALERELLLELAGDDVGTLHEARLITDLLIP